MISVMLGLGILRGIKKKWAPKYLKNKLLFYVKQSIFSINYYRWFCQQFNNYNTRQQVRLGLLNEGYYNIQDELVM